MNLRTVRIPSALAALLAVTALASEARAQASLYGGLGGIWGYGPNSLRPADDSDSVQVDLSSTLPGGLRFHGVTYTDVYINVNGNISFGGALADFTPTAFPGSRLPIIAAWWADVDTRGTDEMVNGQGIFWATTRVGSFGRLVVTWNDVGYFDMHNEKLNRFQLIISRDDAAMAPGDFDIEFRYARCVWTTGDMSGGTGGLGGTAAIAGYDAPGGATPFYSTLPGSGTAAVLDLCRDSNIDEPGAWRLFVRGGDVALCGNDRVEPGEQCDGPLGLPAGVSCTDECRRCGPTEPNPCDAPDAGDAGGTGGDGGDASSPDVPDAGPEGGAPDAGDAGGMDASAPDVVDVVDVADVADVADEHDAPVDPDVPDVFTPPDEPPPTDAAPEVGEPDDVAMIFDTFVPDAMDPPDVPEPMDAAVTMDEGPDVIDATRPMDVRDAGDAARMDVADVGAEPVVERYTGAGLIKCSVPETLGTSNGLPALAIAFGLLAAGRARRRRGDEASE